MVKVFGRETCAPCIQLKKLLSYKGIDYEYVKAEGEEYGRLAKTYGFMIPLTVSDRGVVVGYNPTELLRLLS